MDPSFEQWDELRELVASRDVPANVARRAQIVPWLAEGRRRKDIAELAGVVPLTVDRYRARYAKRASPDWSIAGPAAGKSKCRRRPGV